MLTYNTRSILILVLAACTTLGLLPVVLADTPTSRREWRVPSRRSVKANPLAANAESIQSGRTLYVRECASCHGNTGLGDGPSVGELDVPVTSLVESKTTTQSDGTLYWKLTVGRKPMPGYRRLLDNDERWHLVNYLRFLGQQDSEPEASENSASESLESGTQ